MMHWELAVAALATASVTALLAVATFKKARAADEERLALQAASLNQKDKDMHALEMRYLARQKEAELQFADDLAQARAASFEEGQAHARREHELALAKALADQSAEFSERLLRERDRAAEDARSRTRAEFELQSKLFSVKISPYAEILTDKGFVWDEYETNVGYQYQLLINGIPAFQPHIVVERHEKIKQIDPAIKLALLTTASRCAEAALKTYLGANLQFAELAPPIFMEKKV